jgi:DNA polymerase III alpha subunit
MTDIDIDFPDRRAVLDIIKHIPAAINENGTFKKHNTGVYCHSIPYNPLTDTASIEYKEAEARGYFKIDFLNVNVYKDVKEEEHLVQLMNTEPLWDLLCEKEVCDQLFHINGYHSLLARLKPSNIVELAIVLALIRPGKKHLLGKCETNGFDSVKDEIWTKPTDGSYYFKHSHSVGYAHAIVVQLNLLCEKLSYEYS